MKPVPWTAARAEVCACGGAYRPKINDRGKLVKSRDPAWQMAEQTRDPGCLQELARSMARFYQLGYQHAGDSRKARKGYPDVHLSAPGRGSVFVELKRMGKNPDTHQVLVLAELAAAAHPVFLARPCCALTGALDAIMADLAGVEPKGVYVKQHVTPPASDLPVAPELAATPRPARPQPQLPGGEPPTHMPNPVGYVVPMSAAVNDSDALHQLETWLRAADFPPAYVPFPIRLVTGGGLLAVQVRARDTRVWRGGHTRTPFPGDLAGRLDADITVGPDCQMVMWLIEDAPPTRELPDEAT